MLIVVTVLTNPQPHVVLELILHCEVVRKLGDPYVLKHGPPSLEAAHNWNTRTLNSREDAPRWVSRSAVDWRTQNVGSAILPSRPSTSSGRSWSPNCMIVTAAGSTKVCPCVMDACKVHRSNDWLSVGEWTSLWSTLRYSLFLVHVFFIVFPNQGT